MSSQMLENKAMSPKRDKVSAGESLKHKTVSGVKWQVANKVLQKVISIGTFAILARILEPATFGLFAMAFIAIDGLHIFRSFGLDAALVQRKTQLEEATHTAFWIMQGTGLVLFGICFFIAPIAASFFKHDEMIPIIRALGVVLVFSNISRIPNSLLTREMKFGSIAVIELAGAVANSVFAIFFALLFKSVWSLVAGYVIKQIVMSFLSLRFSSYRVKFVFDLNLAKELFGFGKFMTGLGLLWYVSGNLDDVAVGRFLGAEMLGYFAVAFNIGNFINTHFVQLLTTAIFPAYSKIQGDTEALKRAYLKTVRFVSMLSLPFAITLICAADELVISLYGKQWVPAIILVKLFGVLQLIMPITTCSGPVFLALGKPKYNFNLALAGLCIRAILIVPFMNMLGVRGTVISWITASVIVFPFSMRLIRELVCFSYVELLRQVMPSLLSGASVAVTLVAFKSSLFGFSQINLLIFFVHSLAGVSVYFGVYYLFDRKGVLEAFRMGLNLK